MDEFRFEFTFGGFFDAIAFWFFELAGRGRRRSADAVPARFDRIRRGPSRRVFSVGFFVARSDEHAAILAKKSGLSKKFFFTTLGFGKNGRKTARFLLNFEFFR